MTTKLASFPKASTDAAEAPKAWTDQAKATVYDSMRAVADSLYHMGTYPAMGSSWALAAGATRPGYYQTSEKASEAARQIERVKSLTALCRNGTEDDQKRIESIASSVALIGSFLTGPAPIPVASSGSDGGTALFFEDENFYGDLEINGKSVEYFIKSKTRGKDVEVFDTEDIKDGFVPAKLLTYLFAHYAR